jgi:hypothetical protein
MYEQHRNNNTRFFITFVLYLESGAPVVLLQFPSIAEQFQGYLDYSGREVKKTFSVLFSWRFLVVEPSFARAFRLFESYLDA